MKSKLTLVSMAMLCILFTSCTKEDHVTDTQLDSSVTLRSTTNPIQISFITLDGTPTTVHGTHSEVSYQNATQASLTVTTAGGNSTTYQVSELSLSALTGYNLEITIDSSAGNQTDDLAIELCETELCYSNFAGNLIGTATEFIVDDLDDGM